MIDSEANNDTNQSLDVALKVELKSVGQAIRRNAAAKPEAMAIVSSGYQPMSYRQLAAQFDAFAAALHSAGLGRASRVAIGLKDAPQAALAIVSVCCAAVAVPLDPNLTAVEIETRLKLLEADAAILLASDDSPLRDAVKRLKIPVIEAAAAAERRTRPKPYRAWGSLLRGDQRSSRAGVSRFHPADFRDDRGTETHSL